jgi:perosamine synthetase
MTFDTPALVGALRSYLRDRLGHQGHIPLHEPRFVGNEKAYLNDCVDTGWVSTVGAYVSRFEAMLCTATGAAHCVATVNGTAALHAALLVVGVRPGDEVLCPSLSFVATANAISYCGGVPHFVDIEERTLGVDPQRLAGYLETVAERTADGVRNRLTGRPIRAVVVMHTFGHPVDLDAIAAVCSAWSLALVEDAAESLGSSYRGRHTGNIGVVSALSFNGNKIITTGGGGAVLTNDPQLAARLRHLTTTAKQPHRWAFFHDETGYNYRLPNINAAMGCAQLEHLDDFVDAKRRLTQGYREALNGLDGVVLFVEQDFARSNYWLQCLLLAPACADCRDEVLAATNDAGIMTRPVWEPLHTLPMYVTAPRDGALPVTMSVAARLINIPSSPGLLRP